MAATPLPAPSLPAASHRRRWLIGAAIVGVLLLAYALAIGWAAQRLETDLQSSIRQLPASELDHR